jgi:adenylosuccinate lyase
MTTLFLESSIYKNSWSTKSLRENFEEKARIKTWLEILSVLAAVQSKYKLIPATAGDSINKFCNEIVIDDELIDDTKVGFEQSGHSMQGFINALTERGDEEVKNWLYYGATVQDITDTWFSIVLREAREQFFVDLDAICANAKKLITDHRDTIMVGRTHGQHGLPITFGFKVASWACELDRHRTRLSQLGNRMDEGQLCGGVGSLSSLGPYGLEIQKEFCDRLGLRTPVMSWTTSRDVFVEWCQILVMITGTADRIGHEIYNLQRTEIAELTENSGIDVVGSITMPHKKNPEMSEHLGTLARVVRHNAAILQEGLVNDHERDGRSWKSEWHVLPLVTLLTGKSLEQLKLILANLEVNAKQMEDNLKISGDQIFSEGVMLALAKTLGKNKAQKIVYNEAKHARNKKISFKKSILSNPDISSILDEKDIEEIFKYKNRLGLCTTMVDRVLEKI